MTNVPISVPPCGARQFWCRRGAVAAILVVSGALFASFAAAQPGFSALKGDPGKDAGVAARAPLDPRAMRVRIEPEVTRLRARLERAEPPPPQGIAAAEVEDARRVRALLVVTYEDQLDALAQMEEQGRARETAEKAEREWPGYMEKPPYSILLLDAVREEADAYRAAVNPLKSSRSVIDIEIDRFRDRAQQAGEAVRRASEAVETAGLGTGARAAANWRLEAARGQESLAAEILVASDLAGQAVDVKLAVAQAQQRLAERKLAALAGKTAIGKADIEEAHRRLESFRAQYDRELQSLLKASAQSLRERDGAAKALEALRTTPAAEKASGRDRALVLAEARLRAADVRVQSVGQQIRILTVLVNLYFNTVVESWSWRQTVLTGTDPDARQEARRRLVEVIQYLKLWAGRATTQVDEVRSALREQDQRVRLATDPELEVHERNAREALRALDLALERQRDEVARRVARLTYWQQDFTDAVRARSISEIGADLLVRVKEAARQVWDYELLTIEDKVEVGGKTVTTSRGVTVGKSIGAILLFLLGYRLLAVLSRRAEGLLVRRFEVGVEQAKTFRRWANALGLLALLLLTLNIARIPLTVFAFAGGALAIGIGFGTQTLIKNLISGMIVLVERNVRVGDIIEVEGITGRVMAVDVRSSTVRGFDGVESMIPNSMLLEQKVTNWTLTNANLRRVVKVGVAYGAPTRDVARILAECAERHDAVLKDPAPQVVFEDFGDNALVFALYFWIDLSPGVEGPRVMSDIRFLIDERLAEAGIGIPFPQRDVHLDATRPLRVEVVAPGGTLA